MYRISKYYHYNIHLNKKYIGYLFLLTESKHSAANHSHKPGSVLAYLTSSDQSIDIGT